MPRVEPMPAMGNQPSEVDRIAAMYESGLVPGHSPEPPAATAFDDEPDQPARPEEARSPQVTQEDIRALVQSMLPKQFVDLDNNVGILDGITIELVEEEVTAIKHIVAEAGERIMLKALAEWRGTYALQPKKQRMEVPPPSS